MKSTYSIQNPKKTARVAGLFYLLVAITGFFCMHVKNKLIVPGNTSITANNILESTSLFNIGIVSEVIMAISWILTAIVLYRLFKPENKNHSLIMLSFVIAGGTLACVNAITFNASLLILNSSYFSEVFAENQLEALSMLFLNLSRNGVLINHIFFGLWLLPLGLLVMKSEYFPRIAGGIIGALVIIAGAGYLIDFFSFFLLKSFHSIIDYTFLGEVILLLWLLIKGAKTPLTQIAPQLSSSHALEMD